MEGKEAKTGPIFWMGLFLTYFIMVALLVPDKMLKTTISEEQKNIVSYLGERSAILIVGRSEKTYKALFEDTGLVDEMYSAFLPTRIQQARSKGMEMLGEREGFFAIAEQKINAFWTLIRFSIQRAYSMLVWAPLFAVMALAATWDGLMRRKIKMVGFESTSAPVYGIARHLFVFGLFAPFFYFAAPISIAPVFSPLWGALMSTLLMIKASNLQRI